MSGDLPELLSALDVQPVDGGFVGQPDRLPLPQPFGGHLIAQALVAAGRTVEQGRAPHSLHAYFLRAGDRSGPLHLRVQTLRDGRTGSVRSVRVEQAGRELVHVLASFALPADGPLAHVAAPESVGAPAHAVSAMELSAGAGELDAWAGFGALEVRVVPGAPSHGEVQRNHAWMRASGPVGADPLLHAAVQAYCSDLTLLSSVLVPAGLVFGYEHEYPDIVRALSVDHAVWFHQPAPADEWLLLEQVSPVGARNRGLATGTFFDPSGAPILSVAQEALLR